MVRGVNLLIRVAEPQEIGLNPAKLNAVRLTPIVRVAPHASSWIPFLISVAASTQGNWRVVGDGAGIALRSWDTLAGPAQLVGQPTELGHGLHDPGPLLYWLLAVPVHADPVRGVLWGAALWCMAAASLAIEAAWSVAGAAGGLLSSGLILAMIAWTPSVAVRPYWNPWFGAIFFLAALAASWAAMSGTRRWWPVLVVTASVAAQAHLMFALASAALTLAAFIVCLASALRDKSAGYGWAAAGLIAGMVCWSGPLIQQLTGRSGNLTALLHGQAAGKHTGFAFAMKTLTAFTEPPPLWWMHLQSRLDTTGLIQGRPAMFGAAMLMVTAGVLVAASGLQCHRLANLAAVSLLAGCMSLVTCWPQGQLLSAPLKGAPSASICAACRS